MLLPALFLGCAASLAAGQTAPDPQLSTDNGTLVLMSNEDVLIELYNGSASVGGEGPRFGLLETMSTMAADISSLRAELSAEVRRVERDAATNFSTMRFTTAVAADETSSAISTIRSTAVAASTATASSLSTIRSTAVVASSDAVAASTATASSLSTIRSTAVVASSDAVAVSRATASSLSTIRSSLSVATGSAATARAALSAQLVAARVSADNALFARVSGTIVTTTNTLSRAIATVAARPVTKMIGFKQCEVRAINEAATNGVVVMSCEFRKTRSDSFWVISHNSVMRQGRGYSTWQIEVDGRPCRDRNRNVKGGIDAAMYTDPNQNGHRPTFVRGVCYRTDRRSSITAGDHVVRWRQTYVRGDTYWGWRSNSRIMVEEWMP